MKKLLIILLPLSLQAQQVDTLVFKTNMGDIKQYVVSNRGVFNTINNATAASIATKQNTITVLPFVNGGITGSAATSATTGTISVPMTSRIITCVPTGAMTLNATGGIAGQTVTFVFTTSGASSFVVTFGTNFRKTATLATGTTTNRVFAVTFLCIADNGTWVETGRTAAQT